MTEPQHVERGQVLLLREPASEASGLPERFRLWSVASVRPAKRGASVRLIGWTPGCMMEATATFPGGVVAEPWRVFGLSQGDLALVWAGTRAELHEHRGEHEA